MLLKRLYRWRTEFHSKRFRILTEINPIVAPPGATAGAAIGLGAANIAWAGQDYVRPVNDRYNLNLSRQLPGQILVNATFFMNRGKDLSYTWNYNQVDPRILYQYKGATSVTVQNPFYSYLTLAQFPVPSPAVLIFSSATRISARSASARRVPSTRKR